MSVGRRVVRGRCRGSEATWVLLATFAAAHAGTSCRSPEPPSAAPNAVEADLGRLPPVALPNLARMEPSVQAQVREQHQALTLLVADPHAPGAVVARAYGDLGSLLMAADHIDAAEPCYLRAQALAPDDARWPYYLGHVYLSRADASGSIRAFERALRLQPDDPAALVWLATVYLDQGQPQQAEAYFARALSQQPRMVAALFGAGRAALAQRDYARAVERFEQALAADRRASIVHYPLALAYRGLGDTARADEHLRQQGSVEVGPPDPRMAALRDLLRGSVAEEQRGIRAMDGGDFKTALQHFRAGVELAPDNASLRHKLGTALSLLGDTPGALEQFRETIRRVPTFAQAHYSLGVVLAASGRGAEALDHLAAAVRYQPDYVDARLHYADALRQAGRFDQALVQYREALSTDPRVPDARFGYGMTLALTGRYVEARQVLAEGARLHPDETRFADAVSRVQAVSPAAR